MSDYKQQKTNSVPSEGSPDRTREFIELFSGNSLRIYRFIRSLLSSQADADEVYQNVCSVLWEKFSKYQTGTNFWAWACKVAQYEVLAFRRQQGKQPINFSEEFYQTIAERSSQMPVQLDQQLEALSRCYEKLPNRRKELIDLRYQSKLSIGQIAISLGRTSNAIYKSLHRVHQQLHDCIRKQLVTEDLR